MADTDFDAFADVTPASGDKLLALRGAGGVNLNVDDFLTRDANGDFVGAGFVSPNFSSNGAVRLQDAPGNPDAVYLQVTNYDVTAQYGWMRCSAAGAWTCTGSFTALSDERLKMDIRPSAVGLAEIRQLRGFDFRWTQGGADGRLTLGVIAQHVHRAIPQAVLGDPASGDPLSVEALALIAALINAVNTLADEVDALKTRG